MLQINVCQLHAKERQDAMVKSILMASTAQTRHDVRVIVDEARRRFIDIDLNLGDDVIPCRSSHDFVASQFGTESTMDFFISMMLKQIPEYRALEERESPESPTG